MFPVSPEKHRVRCGIPVALAFEVEDLAEPDYVMPINEDSLDSAIADLREGNDDLLADLFSFYRESLKRMIQFRMDPRMKGRVDASDILQETFLDLSDRLDAYRENDDMPFVVWLRLMTSQRMAAQFRRHISAQKRTAAREVQLQRGPVRNDTSACIAHQLMARINSPSQNAMRDERLVRLQEALEAMNPVDREVLALRHFEDLGNNEVAEILGIQKTAASNRYIRALKRLKEIMSDE